MLAAFLACCLTCGAYASPAAAQADAADIDAVLQSSAVAWSHGDLDAFMQSYEQSADVTFVGRTGLVRGYTAIHDMYARRFGSGGRMGRLTLQVLDDRALGPDHALVTWLVRSRMAARPPVFSRSCFTALAWAGAS